MKKNIKLTKRQIRDIQLSQRHPLRVAEILPAEVFGDADGCCDGDLCGEGEEEDWDFWVVWEVVGEGVLAWFVLVVVSFMYRRS